jgi:hypothetical protein
VGMVSRSSSSSDSADGRRAGMEEAVDERDGEARGSASESEERERLIEGRVKDVREPDARGFGFAAALCFDLSFVTFFVEELPMEGRGGLNGLGGISAAVCGVGVSRG